jgi:hypothetical protein
MTQDEIIEMATQAGMEQDGDMWFSNLYKTDMDVHISHLETFAKLVAAKAAAKEREACAKLAKEYAAEYKEGGRLYPMLNGSITKTAATACDHIVYIIGERGRT